MMFSVQINWKIIMKKIFLMAFAALLLTVAAHAEDTLIKAKAYLDVKTGQWQSPAEILIKGGVISAINPEEIPDGVKVIDLSDQYMLPGLMDMHTHLDLDFNGGFDHIITKEGAANGALRAAKNAEKTLLAGFTTVRNIGTVHITDELIDVALAEAIDKGWVVGPDVIPAGHMITILGGHGDLTLGLSENLIEQSPINGIVSGVNEAIKAVRYQIKNGAKVIKIHATAGVLSLEDSVGAQQLNNEEMKAIVEEAGRHHIKVAAHAHGTEGIIAAIKAGVASIEHGSLLDKEGMRLMKKKGVYLVPTTGLIDSMAGSIDKIDPKMAAKAKYVLPLAQDNLSEAIKQGVPIALGTDAPLIPHGQNALELSAMMNRGMSAIEAIRSATINTADLLGLPDRGEIKVGMRADIIAVDSDALENITVLESVGFVMKKGVVYK